MAVYFEPTKIDERKYFKILLVFSYFIYSRSTPTGNHQVQCRINEFQEENMDPNPFRRT